MKRILLAVLLLLGACASVSDEPMVMEVGTQDAALNGAAGDGSASLLSCSATTYCNAQKAFINRTSGTTWSWSGTCSTSSTWHGTAPGGRTGTATPIGQKISDRTFALSQQRTANVYCPCTGTNVASCHF